MENDGQIADLKAEIEAQKALINGLTAERDQLVIKVGEARAQVADLQDKIEAAENDRDNARELYNELRTEVTTTAKTTALRLNREEAANVSAALGTADKLASELREFLGHFSGNKRAELEQLITLAVAGAEINRMITGRLGSADLAGSVPPGSGRRRAQ